MFLVDEMSAILLILDCHVHFLIYKFFLHAITSFKIDFFLPLLVHTVSINYIKYFKFSILKNVLYISIVLFFYHQNENSFLLYNMIVVINSMFSSPNPHNTTFQTSFRTSLIRFEDIITTLRVKHVSSKPIVLLHLDQCPKCR